jgi:enoyl-[acyl-carrier protein] reductase II
MTAGSGGAAQNRVCELARIDIPIIQAPMTYIAGAKLAAAVSNAGALGIIETPPSRGERTCDACGGSPTVRWARTSR